ncbi:MAG TPA: DinB family protein [Candidatus Cybelea sp.]|nr:DinB family protein [Candidatus Cybelea sp.]
MTREQRREMLDSFGRAPGQLLVTLRTFPKKMWAYKPLPDRWSIHEIILHLADAEANSYVRCRRFIAEPGTSLAKIDAGRWAGSLGYFHQSTREALEVIRRLRKMTHQLLVSVPESVWLHTAEHPRDGSITLEHWVQLQERHIPHHVEHMRANYELWSKTHPPRKSARGAARPSSSASQRLAGAAV